MGANRYSNDAKTGLLALKEMQAIKAHGATDLTRGSQELMDMAHPMDLDMLQKYVNDSRQGLTSSGAGHRDIRTGIGTGIVGRAGTTEALMRGLQEGQTTEEIVQKLLSYPGADDALKGRYRTGGLAHAAIED